jgi:hypothetical protein
VTTAKSSMKLITSRTQPKLASHPVHQWASAARPAPSTSDTSRMKPIARMSPSERSRAFTSRHHPSPAGPGARQMRSSALCSSPSTVVAPSTIVTKPTIAANTLVAGRLALFTSPWIAAAPLSPTRSWSCAKIAPLAARSPNTRPATAITITSSGAMEKMV